MHADGFDHVLSQFPSTSDCVKPLCSGVRQILLPLTKEGKLGLRTPTEPERLYESLIAEFDIAINVCPDE